MKALLCIHRQTKERRILPEPEALDLDQRLWSKQQWTATSGHEKPAPQPFPQRPTLPQQHEMSPIGYICPVRGYYTIYPRLFEPKED